MESYSVPPGEATSNGIGVPEAALLDELVGDGFVAEVFSAFVVGVVAAPVFVLPVVAVAPAPDDDVALVVGVSRTAVPLLLDPPVEQAPSRPIERASRRVRTKVGMRNPLG